VNFTPCGAGKTGTILFEEVMNLTDLETNVQTLVVPGKGILAADESTSTITKREAKLK